jgi:hypothetical protein
MKPSWPCTRHSSSAWLKRKQTNSQKNRQTIHECGNGRVMGPKMSCWFGALRLGLVLPPRRPPPRSWMLSYTPLDLAWLDFHSLLLNFTSSPSTPLPLPPRHATPRQVLHCLHVPQPSRQFQPKHSTTREPRRCAPPPHARHGAAPASAVYSERLMPRNGVVAPPTGYL